MVSAESEFGVSIQRIQNTSVPNKIEFDVIVTTKQRANFTPSKVVANAIKEKKLAVGQKIGHCVVNSIAYGPMKKHLMNAEGCLVVGDFYPFKHTEFLIGKGLGHKVYTSFLQTLSKAYPNHAIKTSPFLTKKMKKIYSRVGVNPQREASIKETAARFSSKAIRKRG